MRIFTQYGALGVAIIFLVWSFSEFQSALRFDIQASQADVMNARVASNIDQTGNDDLIKDLDRYDDPDYGFSVAIPKGWRRIVSDNQNANEGTDDTQMWSEPGYAVGFESPRSNSTDRFADYILIEVLPGDESGLFTSTTEQRYFLHVGDDQIAYDKLNINSESDASIDVDLVVFQHGVQAMGYTVAFYAIGEPANERALFTAFQIMLLTYKQTADPFVII